jgi:hypothetical protein
LQEYQILIQVIKDLPGLHSQLQDLGFIL